MAYSQGYGMSPNSRYQYEGGFRPSGYNTGGGAMDQYGGTGPTNEQYNMQAQSPATPVNNGGPGNPNGANNMAKPMLPRFTGGSFQNNKGMAPLTPFDRQVQGQGSQISQLDQRAIAADPQGFAQWQRDAAAAGYNYGNAGTLGYNGSGINPGNMAQQLQGMNVPAGFRPFARGFGQSGFGAGQEAQDQDMMQRQQGYRRPMYNDPYQQYGYAGQSQSLGRYQPPMMSNPYDPQGGWLGSGGYSYNIPNSYGSGQWNQFNSTDTANRNFGQTQNQPVLGVNQSVRYGQPSPQYQSPFASGDPSRAQNLYAYMQSVSQPQQPPQYTQPGAPSQPGPVT